MKTINIENVSITSNNPQKAHQLMGNEMRCVSGPALFLVCPSLCCVLDTVSQHRRQLILNQFTIAVSWL